MRDRERRTPAIRIDVCPYPRPICLGLQFRSIHPFVSPLTDLEWRRIWYMSRWWKGLRTPSLTCPAAAGVWEHMSSEHMVSSQGIRWGRCMHGWGWEVGGMGGPPVGGGHCHISDPRWHTCHGARSSLFIPRAYPVGACLSPPGSCRAGEEPR